MSLEDTSTTTGRLWFIRFSLDRHSAFGLARDTEGFVDRALGNGDRGPTIQEDDGFVQIGPVRLPKVPQA